MIKGIAGGNSVVVSGGSVSYPYVPMNSNNPIQGMVRVNGQDMQVFDGSSWITMGSSYASVELTPEVQSIIEWARKKKAEEQRLDELCEKYPGLRKARDNYEVFLKLVQSEESV